MKSDENVKNTELFCQRMAWVVLLATAALLAAIQQTEGATNVVVWDTGSRIADAADMENRAGWHSVPSELFAFEADPPKAASDPGYWGREHSFKGDAVVENRSLVALFWSAKGRVVIYSKGDATAADRAATHAPRSQTTIMELVPLQNGTELASISRTMVIRNASDEVILEVSFSGKDSSNESVLFTFGKTGIVEIKPTGKLKGLRLFSPIEYGVVPAFIGDDLIFDPAAYASANSLSIPSENLFLGLLKGGDRVLVVTWPKGGQRMKLGLGNDRGHRLFESIDFENDEQSFYVATLAVPGIWHREALKPSHLEKDVASQWRKPFPAKWKTQLSEGGVRTTFAFRETKGQIWRGVPGSYNYPVWFHGDEAFYHLSKKVPPKGESIIYFVEGQNTPLSISTPVDIMKATLGRPMSESILDPAGRKLRTHHRRGGDGVHRACTCGCTEVIQAIFEAGQEVEKKDYVREALGDMNYFVQCHVERIEEYQRFAGDTIKFLQAKRTSSPELKADIENLEQIAQQIPQEYSVQKGNMKSLEHAVELTRQTMALTASKSTNNLPAYLELGKAWREMGGAQDYVIAQCHTVTRKLFQEAGYGCVHDTRAVALAQEIRARCRQVLRNPDGYEIWAEY